MKQFFLILAISVIVDSCKSDAENTDNPKPVLLLGYQTFTWTTSQQIALDYDQQNRITRVSRLIPNQVQQTLYDISYDGNVIRFVAPFTNTDSTIINTTISLTIDGDRVIKRIENTFLEFKEPGFDPQRSYIYDSLGYTYDNAGLLLTRNGVHFDSTWFNPGTERILLDSLTITQNFSNTGGNLTASDKTTGYRQSIQQGGNTVNSTRSMEENVVYHYNSAFSNKTDFLNQLILQELDIFMHGPVSSLYTNIPDRLVNTVTDRDGNGNITGTTTTEVSRLLTFNDEGYVISIADAANPANKTLFYYNQ